MRRLFFFVLSVALAGGLVTACGEDDTTPSEMDNDDMTDMGHGENTPVAEGAREVVVNADRLAFDPMEIRVALGEAVAVTLTAGDVEHDLTIDELDLHVAAEAGKSGVGGFTADQPGEYPFYCSVDGHRESGMEGTIVVT